MVVAKVAAIATCMVASTSTTSFKMAVTVAAIRIGFTASHMGFSWTSWVASIVAD